MIRANNSPPEGKPLLDELAQGFRKRTWTTTRLASKLGRKALRALRGKEQKAVAPEKAIAAAESLVSQIEGLKGLVMKVGQMASYLPGGLPEEAQRVMARLQAQSTAMTWEKVSRVVESELGAHPDALFDEIEHEAFAAASIGQVHRARFEGRPVAVKIQYPGIEELLRSDLRTFGIFARLSMMGTSGNAKEVVDELKARVLEECDYLREMANQQLFIRLFADEPRAHVPAPIPERTARRVFTSELIDASEFYSFCDTAPQEVKDRAAQTIFSTCFQSIFRHCIYNADPHPGNYLFTPDGDVTFLDFGCVRTYSPDMIDAWKRVALATLDNDRATFERYFPELGMTPNLKKFDWDYHWGMMQHLYSPFMQRDPYFTYTQEHVRESYDTMIFGNPNMRKIATPPEWVFLNRLQWGLNSVLAYLHATGPWPDLWRAAVESPTEPVAAPEPTTA